MPGGLSPAPGVNPGSSRALGERQSGKHFSSRGLAAFLSWAVGARAVPPRRGSSTRQRCGMLGVSHQLLLMPGDVTAGGIW